MIAIPIVLVLFLLYLFLIAPKKTKDMEKYKSVMYAHRGLHNEERAENSISAFRAAVEAGYGIELDIRLSKDGELVVFHDDTLDRVCGREGKVIDFTSEELAEFKLSGTEDGIPRFADVLALVDGKVPLLVEIKEDAGNSAVSEAACKMLADYKGDFIFESFNPLSMRTVKKGLPSVSRGVLSHRYYEYEQYKKPLYFLLQSLLLNFLCRPAFIAYDHRHAKAFSLRFVRAFFKAPTLAWTVRSAEEEKIARENGFDGIIFENYTP
ncbi:MAG: glycerophosphodiester phosphodiesterase [Ruminococcaceae bacterium]|nr:glycerophosphodiester phosphodiesterase [Oscillospiraceae bacterium]